MKKINEIRLESLKNAEFIVVSINIENNEVEQFVNHWTLGDMIDTYVDTEKWWTLEDFLEFLDIPVNEAVCVNDKIDINNEGCYTMTIMRIK